MQCGTELLKDRVISDEEIKLSLLITCVNVSLVNTKYYSAQNEPL